MPSICAPQRPNHPFHATSERFISSGMTADHSCACARSLSQLAQRGSSRGLNTPPQGLTNIDAIEHMATGQLETDSQTNSWDPELVSRSSSVAFPDDLPQAPRSLARRRRAKERIRKETMIRRLAGSRRSPCLPRSHFSTVSLLR
jgi:hypothetical protein